MKKTDQAEPMTASQMELRHLCRDVKTALELAIVALSPSEIVESLAMSAGFLGALDELPLDSPAVAALLPGVDRRAHAALDAWAAWRDKHLRKVSA